MGNVQSAQFPLDALRRLIFTERQLGAPVKLPAQRDEMLLLPQRLFDHAVRLNIVPCVYRASGKTMLFHSFVPFD